MANVISLDKKLKLAEKEKTALVKKRKVQVFRKSFSAHIAPSSVKSAAPRSSRIRMMGGIILNCGCLTGFAAAVLMNILTILNGLKARETRIATGTMTPGWVSGEPGSIIREAWTAI